MRAVAENPKFAKKVGVPQSVGREFSKSGGGEMKESKTMMKKEVAFMKKKGAPKSMVKHEMAEAGMKKGGMAKKPATKKYAAGGLAAGRNLSRTSAGADSSADRHGLGAGRAVAADLADRAAP